MNSIKRTVHQTVPAGNKFIIVNDMYLGNILFGCPPEIIKHFSLDKIPIPDVIRY